MYFPHRVIGTGLLWTLLAAGVMGIVTPGLWNVPEVSAQDTKQEAEAKTPESVMNGWRWFHVYCFRCHGMDAVGSQIAPNLRASIKAMPHDEFIRVIHDGRPGKGMQAWNVLLDMPQMEDIYQYVLARSEGRLKAGRPDEQ